MLKGILLLVSFVEEGDPLQHFIPHLMSAMWNEKLSHKCHLKKSSWKFRGFLAHTTILHTAHVIFISPQFNQKSFIHNRAYNIFYVKPTLFFFHFEGRKNSLLNTFHVENFLVFEWKNVFNEMVSMALFFLYYLSSC